MYIVLYSLRRLADARGLTPILPKVAIIHRSEVTGIQRVL